MLKMRIALLGALALFIVSGIAASAASAAGPYWRVSGTRLESGTKQLKLQNKNTAVLKSEIGTEPLTITCNTSISEGATIEGNGTLQGQGKGRISFTSCKTSIANCLVSEPITTMPTKSHLVTVGGGTQIDVLFEPTEGKTFTTLTLVKGAGACLLAGPHEVTGSVAAVASPEGSEAQEGLLIFPEKPIAEVKKEGAAAVKIGLFLGVKEAKFSASYGARLVTGEKYGVFAT